MTDNEAGFIVYVAAEEVKGSGKKAVRGIAKEIEAENKAKKTVVPVDISVDISDTDKKVQNAQAKVIKNLKEMTAEGFSASNDDVKKLKKSLTGLGSAMDKAGIGRQNNLYRIISKKVNELDKSVQQAQIAEKSIHDYTTKVNKNRKTKKQNTYDDYLKQQEEHSKRAQGAGKRAELIQELKAVRENKSLMKSSGNIKASNTNPRAIQLSEYSPYGSISAYIQSKHTAEERKKSDANLNTWVDKNYQPSKGGKPTTEQEQNAFIAAKSLRDLGETLRDIELGNTEITKEMIVDQLGIIKTTFEKAGQDLETTSIAIKNMMEGKYSDNANKRLGSTSGKEKGVGPGHELAKESQKFIYNLWDKVIKAADPAVVYAKRFAKEISETGKTVKKANDTLKKDKTTQNSQYEKSKESIRQSDSYKDIQNLATNMQDGTNTLESAIASQSATESMHYAQDIHESSREESADKAEGQKNREILKELSEDATTGFNSDAKANEAIASLRGLSELKEMMCPCETVLQAILSEIKTISTKGITITDKKASSRQTKQKTQNGQNSASTTNLPMPVIYTPYFHKNQFGSDEFGRNIVPGGTFEKTHAKTQSILEDILPTISFGVSAKEEETKYADAQINKVVRQIDEDIIQHVKELQKRAEQEMSTSSAIVRSRGLFGPLLDSIREIFPSTKTAKSILAMSKEQQAQLQSELTAKYGLAIDKSGIGDKIRAQRVKNIFNWSSRNRKNPFEDLQLSEGINLDTTKLTENLQNTIEKNMFSAQTGGWLKNLLGPMTLYLGQPSLEKSRAQIEGLNTIMADMRNAAQSLLETIQERETTLIGMRERGQAVFDSKGRLVEDKTSGEEATTIFNQLENSKDNLRSILADIMNAEKITKLTHGNVAATIKLLGLASPELRKDNVILQNLNANLDKNGKALKYQTRLGEILSYSFQLMARHIGQMFRNLLALLNPFALIKKAFQDFMSYDTKWKRTMNVIKYNIRAILRPFMEWLAQQLVNILGVIDIVSMRIQSLFGQKPISLFDQDVANAEKMREELEEAKNITAGFDELHDISGDSNSSAENDLMGEIYKPQLSKEWEDFANGLADIFEGIAKAIKWCIDNWQLFVSLLAGFLIVKGLWDLLTFFGMLGLSLGGILSTLLLIAGVAATIWGILEEIKWFKDYGKMTSDERMKQGDKAIGIGEIGGALLGGFVGSKVGGLAGGVIGAFIGDGIAEAAFAAFNTGVSYWKGNTKETKHFSEKLGEGIGKAGGAIAGAKIGAAIGTALAPGVGTAIGGALGAAVGWAVGSPVGKALGNAIGDGLNALQDITRGKGAFQKMRVDAEEVEKAYEGLKEKTDLYNKTLAELQEMEDASGESGKALYDSVENGTKSYWGLTEAQKAVYDKYKELIQAEKDMNEMRSTSFEKASKLEEQEAKKSGNYEKYITTLKDGVSQGIISHDEMMDHLAQTYGSIDANAKKTFVEQLPSYYRKAVIEQGQEYETWGNKLVTFSNMVAGRMMNDFKELGAYISDGWNQSGVFGAIEGFFKGQDANMANRSNNLKMLKASQEDLEKSTDALAQAQARQNEIQAEVDRLQQLTGDSAEDLITKLANGEIAYESLSSDQQALVNSYDTLQQAIANTNRVNDAHIMSMASVDLQAATTSGNYDAFIQNLIDANKRGEISAQEMEDLFAQAYASMNNSTRESFEGQLKNHGIMVDGIRTQSNEYLGFMGQLAKGIGNAWTDIKEGAVQKVQEMAHGVSETWEGIKRFASETWEGIKTNVAQAWEGIWKAATGWIENLWNTVTDIFGKIGDFIEGTWQRIVNFFSGKGFKTNEEVDGQGNKKVSVQAYAVGTNYVPSDGLAYLHEGEAVIPAKYNKPFDFNNNSNLENAIDRLSQQVAQIRTKVDDGIAVKGQFIQRGSDLVATVEKANNKLSNNILNNRVFAR